MGCEALEARVVLSGWGMGMGGGGMDAGFGLGGGQAFPGAMIQDLSSLGGVTRQVTTGATASSTSSSPDPANAQLQKDMQALHSELAGLSLKSGVTVADLETLNSDTQALGMGLNGVDPAALKQALNDLAAAATGSTKVTTAAAQSEFTGLFPSSDATAAGTAFDDLTKIVTDSGVTATDLSAVAADAAAIKTDLGSSSSTGGTGLQVMVAGGTSMGTDAGMAGAMPIMVRMSSGAGGLVAGLSELGVVTAPIPSGTADSGISPGDPSTLNPGGPMVLAGGGGEVSSGDPLAVNPGGPMVLAGGGGLGDMGTSAGIAGALPIAGGMSSGAGVLISGLNSLGVVTTPTSGFVGKAVALMGDPTSLGGSFKSWGNGSAMTASTTQSSSPTQLETDVKALGTELQSLAAKSQVTVADLTLLMNDSQALGTSLGAVDPTALKQALSDLAAAATGSTKVTTASAQSEFTGLFPASDATAAGTVFNDLTKIVTDSGVTASDLSAVAADQAAIQTDLGNPKDNGQGGGGPGGLPGGLGGGGGPGGRSVLVSTLNSIGVIATPVNSPTPTTPPTTTSTDPTRAQLEKDQQALETELQSLASKSGVTVADVTKLDTDSQTLATALNGVTPSALQKAISDLAAAATGSTTITSAAAQTEFTGLFPTSDATAAGTVFNDLIKIVTDSGVTASDLSTVAADQAAIQTDLGNLKNSTASSANPNSSTSTAATISSSGSGSGSGSGTGSGSGSGAGSGNGSGDGGSTGGQVAVTTANTTVTHTTLIGSKAMHRRLIRVPLSRHHRGG